MPGVDEMHKALGLRENEKETERWDRGRDRERDRERNTFSFQSRNWKFATYLSGEV